MRDPFVARAIAGADADTITLKLGMHVVHANAMRLRTFIPPLHGFLDLIREGQSETPIAVITSINCAAHENTPGSTWESAPGHYAGTPGEQRPGDGTLPGGCDSCCGHVDGHRTHHERREPVAHRRSRAARH